MSEQLPKRSDVISVRFQPTVDDHVAARGAVTWGWENIVLFFSLLFMGITAAAIAVFGPLAAGQIACAEVIIYIAYELRFRHMVKVWEKDPRFQHARCYEICNDCISVSTGDFECKYKWSWIVGWVESRTHFVFLKPGNACEAIPKKAFQQPADIENLRQILRALKVSWDEREQNRIKQETDKWFGG